MRVLFLALLGLALSLTACTAPAAPAHTPGPAEVAFAADEAPPTPSPTATATATVTATPTPSVTPSPAPPTPTPQPTACADTQGTLQAISVPSRRLGYALEGRVYLPPCYAASDERYPVVYLLHGLGFTDDQWERLGAPAAADALIAAGEIAPLIIVMPRDRRDARLDPALVEDLIPYIDTQFRTRAERAARAIGGLSRGGGWAVHFGLRYPALFGRIGLHSPAVFYEDEVAILEWTRQLRDRPQPAIYIDSGEDDATLRSPVWLDQVFTWFKLDHVFVLQPGGHSEKYWSQHVHDYLRFYAADWRSLPPPDDGPASNRFAPVIH